MPSIYLAIFQHLYRWSAKLELNAEPSLYSTVLYMSVLQFLNLLSILFAVSVMFDYKPTHLSRWWGVEIVLGLALLNVVFAFRNEVAVREAPRGRPSGAIYVGATAAIFIATLIAFVADSPVFS